MGFTIETKKKLKILNKEKRDELIEDIVNKQHNCAEIFRKQFSDSKIVYLGDFPQRKLLFDDGIKMNCLLLVNMTEIFLNCENKPNNYAWCNITAALKAMFYLISLHICFIV